MDVPSQPVLYYSLRLPSNEKVLDTDRFMNYKRLYMGHLAARPESILLYYRRKLLVFIIRILKCLETRAESFLPMIEGSKHNRTGSNNNGIVPFLTFRKKTKGITY